MATLRLQVTPTYLVEAFSTVRNLYIAPYAVRCDPILQEGWEDLGPASANGADAPGRTADVIGLRGDQGKNSREATQGVGR